MNNKTNAPVDTKNTKSRSSDANQCSICLETIENRCRSNICDHQFCLQCLHHWSTEHNRCPVCRQEFTEIWHNFRGDNATTTTKTMATEHDTIPVPNRERELNFGGGGGGLIVFAPLMFGQMFGMMDDHDQRIFDLMRQDRDMLNTGPSSADSTETLLDGNSRLVAAPPDAAADQPNHVQYRIVGPNSVQNIEISATNGENGTVRTMRSVTFSWSGNNNQQSMNNMYDNNDNNINFNAIDSNSSLDGTNRLPLDETDRQLQAIHQQRREMFYRNRNHRINPFPDILPTSIQTPGAQYNHQNMFQRATIGPRVMRQNYWRQQRQQRRYHPYRREVEDMHRATGRAIGRRSVRLGHRSSAAPPPPSTNRSFGTVSDDSKYDSDLSDSDSSNYRDDSYDSNDGQQSGHY